MSVLRSLALAAATAAVVLSSAPDARACGGCFHPQAEVGSSVVTDHRMVFKISKEETILWDQVRYTGSPEEFAWVLPVREGARVELSRDEFIAALDASTRTTVTSPERFCGGGGGGGGGCASFETTSLSGARDNGSGGGKGEGFSGNGDVEVLSQGVIGPYQAVTIRATGGKGIAEWLDDNGFAIPDEVKPTIAAYTAERFDFIALRLRPGEGVQAMRPVRVVTQGADTTLPLRMVAAGVGARVGLTLWVIGEGRYKAQNFPDAVIDYERLVWDGRASRSNLSDLQREALSANGGRGWLTEAAMFAATTPNATPRRSAGTTNVVNGALPNPTLYLAYNSQCVALPPRTVKCDESDLPPPNGSPDGEPLPDAGADASSGADGGDEGGAPDAAADSGATPPDSQPCTKRVSGCDGFDDLEVATRGLSANDVFVTRLRADLPVSALAEDLRLEAAAQSEIDPQHHTEKFSDPSFDPCGGANGAGASDDDGGACACRATRPTRGALGSVVIAGATALVASRLLRRRRR